jgi:hypothetical protein
MIALVAIALLLALMVQVRDAFRSGAEAARRSQCVGNLKHIVYALHTYESAWGRLPPAYSTDAQGRPLLSWRVLILPYLEQNPLWDQFHTDEPWDSPHNIRLIDDMPYSYQCPTHRPDRSIARRFTSYFALSAPGTAMSGPTPIRFDQVTDGTSRTLLLVESMQADVPWTSPVDIDPRMGRLTNAPSDSSTGPVTPHVRMRCLNAAAADGMILGLDPDRLRPLLLPASTMAGGESLDFTRLRAGARPR